MFSLSCRACWGKPFILNIRYISHHAQASDDFELWTHSNECLALVRRHIMQRWEIGRSESGRQRWRRRDGRRGRSLQEEIERWLSTKLFVLEQVSSLYRLKLSYTNRLELSVGNEVLRPNEDKRLVSTIPLRDRMVRSDITWPYAEGKSSSVVLRLYGSPT